MPKVSVCLPCRNAAATLPAALDSLLGQTLADFEVLAVDDGSTDDTWRVLTDYARRDPRIRPMRQPHTGVAQAGNAAVEAARAPYVARMDADDISLPLRLEVQAALLDADPGLGLVSGLVRFGGSRELRQGYAVHVDWLNTLKTPEDISLHRFVESPLCNPSVMFRRELFEELGGARECTRSRPFPEDYEMWLRWLERGVRMGKAQEEVLVWNDPPTRLTRTHADYSLAAFADIRAQYLWRWLAWENPNHPAVWVWGAGRTSRQRLAPLVDLGLEIEAYIDIDPAKIGQRVHGTPVLSRDSLPAPAQEPCPPEGEAPGTPDTPETTPPPFILVNVGSRGAREEIRAWLESKGWVLGEGFMLVG